ncbi:MAG: V-type ATP synthase subunit D [bacterium]
MSKRLNISITKSNVLRFKEELDFAQEGYELLEQKREVLVMEIMVLIEDFRQCKKEVEESLALAYDSLKKTNMLLGKKGVEKAALSAVSCEKISIKDRSIMGIVVPIISYTQKKACCNQYGFKETSHCLDQTVKLFYMCLEKLARLAQIEITLYRLANELKKTQRRANALSNIFIPEYRDTIKYLEDSLEEKERETLFQLKRVKNNHR